MKTRTYRVKDIIEFINKQKDDRGVDSRSSHGDDVGNVLMHFARKKLKRKITTVGLTKIGTVNTLLVPQNASTEDFMRRFIAQMSKWDEKSYRRVKEEVSTSPVLKALIQCDA